MDKIISTKEISRILYSRSMHRMNGNPSIATLNGYLSVIFIIRSAANLFLIYSYSAAESTANYAQISIGWILYLCSYFIFCSSLSAFHVSFAVPLDSFLGNSPNGKTFRRIFLRQAAIIRPMNITMFALGVIGFFIFTFTNINFLTKFSLIIITVICITMAYGVFRLSIKLKLGKQEMQILEAVLLSTLVILNPDIVNHEGKIIFLIYGSNIPFDNFLIVAISIVSIGFLVCILLFFTKFVTAINIFLQNKKSTSSPLVSWYFHFFKITFWFVLYMIMIPLLSLNLVSHITQAKIFGGYAAFCVISYIFFLMNCENTIQSELRCKLLKKKNILYLSKVSFLHLGLTCLPAIFFMF
ncbi:MAG: hypothetical protein PQJ46_15450 [Spirochaetales bacterium]|nr:hypothetical protein [Spirochaetales bacterium]